MVPPHAGRLLWVVPVACFILAAIAGVTALAGLVGLTSYSLDRGLGLADAPSGLMIAVPFGALSVMAFLAGQEGPQLKRPDQAAVALDRVRGLVTFGLLALLIGSWGSVALGFVQTGGTGQIAEVAVLAARLGIGATVLALLSLFLSLYPLPPPNHRTT